MKHHNIILIVDGTTTFHDSIDDAIKESNLSKYDDSKIAHIYAYLKTARKGGFRWNTDKPKVVRIKPPEKRFMKRWTDAEQKLLIQAKKDGKTIKEIAQALCRTERAVQLRWNKTQTIKRAIQHAQK